MIYTVTLNPALDRAIVVDSLTEEDTTRVIQETCYAAGKGIDVSRVVRELKGKSVALGLVGGYDGLQLEGLLINAGVMTDFTRISNETRTNIILREKSTGRQFVISAAGPEVNATEIGQLYQHVLHTPTMDYLVLSGSLPRGVSPNLYGQLILAGRKKEAFVLLDADGKALQESIDYQPTCIKPNQFELSRLVGKDLHEESDIILACEDVHERGIPYVLVSRGKEGLILSNQEEKIKAVAPPVEVESTVGAGDSAVAGFILAHSQGKSLSDCVRLACAAGTATAQTPGSELCHFEDVEKILPLVEITYI
ncbi:MAG: 1-phosphofructokinase [Thermodesulfobacteriota bacterium]|nr:1-phosphofructokinase [Thermodesulfobacteriota bacterium]